MPKPKKPDPADLWNLDRKQTKLVEKMAGQGIEALFDFCIPRSAPSGINPRNRPRIFDAKTLQIAMRRFVSVAWLLHSEMLVDDELDAEGVATGKLVPLTLDRLGKLPQLDCTKVALSLLAKRFGDHFKFHARVQKRVETKPNYAAAALTGWAKRRAREAAATTA
jgi:hypothetical protein